MPYCIDLHTRDLRANGVAIEKLMLVSTWHEAEALFDARERAALGWAEAITRVEATGVPDGAHASVASAFDDRELADLTLAISLMNAYNRLAISFRRPPASVRKSMIASGHRR